VPHNAATAPSVGQIRVGRDMALDFRVNRLGKQLTRAGPQMSVRGSSENDPGWRKATTVSSFMAYPFFGK